jgi:hypothetical protein
MAKKPVDLAKQLRDCQKRLSDALDVLENIKYAADNGDWDILDAAAIGAERELKRNGRNTKDEDK